MKICFISPKSYLLFNPKTKGSFGGSEVQLYLLGKGLVKNRKLKIVFMVGDYGQAEKEFVDGVEVYKFFNFKSPKIFNVISFLKIFNKINGDVYIQRAMSSFSFLIALLCKFKKKKFIYMIANNKEVERRGIIGLVFNFASVIIVQNKFQEEALKKRNVKKIKLILSSGDEIKNDKDFIRNKEDYILWVGRIEKHYKNSEGFLELAKMMPSKEFLMIGQPATGQKSYFKDIRKDLQKIKNIKFIESVSFFEINKYFEKAKIFVSTSFSEGFPHTFVQAVQNGTPIISLNVNPNNFLSGYNCGFMCKGDFKIMMKNIERLFNDKSLYDQFSNNCYCYAKQNHDITINTLKFLDVVKNL